MMLRLAIVGDTHYLNPAYHQRAVAGQSRSPTEPVDVRRHTWTTERVLPRLVEELRAAAPDVVLQLGDVVQGRCDDDAGNQAELHEMADFLQGIGRPLLFARGTHEGRPGSPSDATYRERFLSKIARTLGVAPGSVDTSYAYAAGGCRVIVLDYTTFRPNGPADQLLHSQLTEAARRGERVFVCGHPPLIPVGRPFFTRLEYAPTVLSRLATSPVPVDAYFCGHTHNQVATLHHVTTQTKDEGRKTNAAVEGDSSSVVRPSPPGGAGKGQWLPQLQSAPVGYPAMDPVPLAAVRPLLPDPRTVQYGWGYLEDSAPGWYLVDVDGSGVRVRWRRIGQHEDQGEVRWSEAGSASFARVPAPPAPIPLPEWPLEAGDPRVVSIRLRAAGVGSRAPHRVRLNGVDAGVLPVLDYFDARQGMTVPEACWDRIHTENDLLIEPADAEERCLGGFVLEITLAGGQVLRSQVAPELYATSEKWEPWRWCTPALRRISPSQPLRIPLHFAQ